VSTELAKKVEALLFLANDPLSAAELAEATEVSEADVSAALEELAGAYAPGERGLVLRDVAGGFTLASAPLAEDAARALLGRPRHSALTAAQLETLAIVAYLQPVSRPEIARIRGVNAESPVATLLDRSLITESGRSEFGAVLYRTTSLFLKVFDLQSLDDLPDPSQWDATAEEEGELRDRLLSAGDARSGTAGD
jgi:segregation and condensation protein B